MPETRETTDYISSETTKECPQCGKLNNATNKFCVKCRAPLPDSVSSARPAAPPLPTIETSQPSPVPPITDFLPPHQVAQTLRQLYFDLGIALSQKQRYKKAAEAFQNALHAEDQGDGNTRAYDMLMHLAYAHEKSDNPEQAFHSYVEAVFHKPEQARPVLSHARSLLTPDIALLQGKWVISECTPRINDSDLPAATRRDMALLVAYIHMSLTNYDQAVEALKQAVQIAPDDFPAAAADLLAPDQLPPALARYTRDSNVSYLLARLYKAAGDTQQATLHLDHAFELLLSTSSSGKPTLPVGAYELKAELLAEAELRKADGKKEDAALRLFESAQQYYFKSEFRLAVALFRAANKLNPDYLATYWYLADALRLLSQDDPAVFPQSIEAWDQGRARLQQMDDDNSWAYIVRGLIYEAQCYLPETRPWVAAWQAVCCAEQAMMYVAARSAITYAYLGRFYRNVSMERNSLEITAKAVELESENVIALNERTVSLANVGEFEQAKAITEKWVSIDPTASVDAINGFLAWHLGQHAEALALLNSAVKQYPTVIWYRASRGYFSHLQGDFEQAAEDNTWLWRKFEEKGSADLDNVGRYATAAYLLGKYTEALDILNKLPDIPFQDASFQSSLSGLCYLALGQLEPGENALNTSIPLIINQRQIRDLLNDLSDLATIVESQPYKEQVLAIIERMKERVRQRGLELEHPLSAEQELLAILLQTQEAVQSEPDAEKAEETGGSGEHQGEPEARKTAKTEESEGSAEHTAVPVDKSDGWSWVAAAAGLARIYVEQERWIDAAKVYYALYIKAKERFPEARMGIEMVCDHLLDESAKCFRANEFGDYFKAVRDAIQHLLSLIKDDWQRIARAFTQLVYFNFPATDDQQSDPAEALASFEYLLPYVASAVKVYQEDFPKTEGTETDSSNGLFPYFLIAFQLYRDSHAAEAGKAVGLVWRTMLSSIADYWDVDQMIGKFVGIARELAADKKIDEGVYDNFVAVRAELSVFLDEYFQLKESAAGANTFAPFVNLLALEIGLDLIPPPDKQSTTDWKLFSEYIPAMRKRLKQEFGIEIPGIQVRDNLNLHPNEYAFYIDEVRVTRGEIQLGQSSEDPSISIIAQCELALRKNMANLLGVQEVRTQFSVRQKNEKEEEFLQKQYADADAAFHFARLIETLVRESLPITSLENIIAATQGLDLAHGSMNDIVRSVCDQLNNQQAAAQQTAASIEEQEKTGGTHIGA